MLTWAAYKSLLADHQENCQVVNDDVNINDPSKDSDMLNVNR